MKIALIGKHGQLGWELNRSLAILGEVVALGRADVDVADHIALQTLLNEIKPDLIINASAYTDVDQAETQIELAQKINVIAPAIMAERARKLNAVFVHFSTDYVFDGRKGAPYNEQDATHPLNFYGESKLRGEEHIKQAGDAYLILRTSWVYSMRGNSFVNKVLGWARKNQTLKIVSDQVSSPTWARELAEVTTHAIHANTANFLDIFLERRGIYHLAGGGYTSRYDWARQILASDPKPTEQLVQTIEPVSSSEFPTPATRPMFSALSYEKFAEAFGLRLSNWKEALQLAMTE